MNKKKIISFLCKILENKKKIPRKYKEDVNKFNFVESGFIDSMEIFLFIVKIEKKFKIKLSTKEINSRSFKTIGGVVDLIIRKKIKN